MRQITEKVRAKTDCVPSRVHCTRIVPIAAGTRKYYVSRIRLTRLPTRTSTPSWPLTFTTWEVTDVPSIETAPSLILRSASVREAASPDSLRSLSSLTAWLPFEDPESAKTDEAGIAASSTLSGV